jgi:hypothetical protein
MTRRAFTIYASGVALVLASCERPAPSPPPAAPTPASPPAIAPAPTPAPEPRVFLPSTHGFAFVNAFKGSPLPPALRRLPVFAQDAIPARFGLCGGMCLLAADYFHADAPMPQETEPPADGTPLYAAIYQRQLDSFDGINLPLRVLQLMASPDAGPNGLEALTARELPGIREQPPGPRLYRRHDEPRHPASPGLRPQLSQGRRRHAHVHPHRRRPLRHAAGPSRWE